MPSFMPIGPKLWALEGYRQTNKPSYFNNIDLNLHAKMFISARSCVFDIFVYMALWCNASGQLFRLADPLNTLGIKLCDSSFQIKSFNNLGFFACVGCFTCTD